MNSKIIKDNTELLKLFKDYSFKKKSSLEEREDMDIVITSEEKNTLAKKIRKMEGKCFLNSQKGDAKFIIPLKESPFFRIIHLNVKNSAKRSLLLKIFSFLSYWKGSTTIVVVGVDGSGKTTMIKEMNSILSSFFNTSLQYFGWKDFVIPLFKNTSKKSREKENSKKDSVSGEKVGWLHMFVFYFEMLCRYILRVSAKKILGRVILIDRYFYDKLIHLDKKSFKFRFFYALTPKPDVCILLVADPKLLYSRKNELHISKIMRNQNLYLSNKDFFNLVVVKNSGGISKTVEKIIKEIRALLIKRKRVIE